MISSSLQVGRKQSSPAVPTAANHTPTITVSNRPQYEFIVTTSLGGGSQVLPRQSIRSHVMRNTLRQKVVDRELAGSASASAIKPIARPQKEMQRKFRVKGQDEARKTVSLTEIGFSSQAIHDSDALPLPALSRARIGPYSWPPPPLIETLEKIDWVQSSKAVLQCIMRSIPRMAPEKIDPFDTLPVRGGFEIDKVLYDYYTGDNLNRLRKVTRPLQWMKLIVSNKAMLHATLAISASHCSLVHLCDTSYFVLYHKGEALRAIYSNLSSGTTEVSDSVVGAVATMACAENLGGEYQAAEHHAGALARLVNSRGGVNAYSHNTTLQSYIIWADSHSAAISGQKPKFQCLPELAEPPLPLGLLQEAALTSPMFLLEFRFDPAELFNIFQPLHRLGIARNAESPQLVSHATMSQMVSEVEHRTLFELHRMRSLNHRSQTDSSIVAEALSVAALIFLYCAIRDVPIKARTTAIFLARLLRVLKRDSQHHTWLRIGNRLSLLWTLLIGYAAAEERDTREWFLLHSKEMASSEEFSTKEEFQRRLRQLPWTDKFCAQASERVWQYATAAEDGAL